MSERRAMDTLDVVLAHVSRQQLAAAAAWHVVRSRQITQFPNVLEFLETIHAAAPELVTYRHYAKMMLGLKALIVVNMIYEKQSRRSINLLMNKFFPDPAPPLPAHATRRDHMKISSAVETFKDTVQRLPIEQRIRAEYVKAELEEEYGEEFLTALEKLLREYFVRFESTMFKPRIQELQEAMKPAGRSLRSKDKESLLPLRILLCYFSDMGWPSCDWTSPRADLEPPTSSRILPRRSCHRLFESNEGTAPKRSWGRDCLQHRNEEKADAPIRISRKTLNRNYTSTDEVLRCACEMLHPSMESFNVASTNPLSTPTGSSLLSNKKHPSHLAISTQQARNLRGNFPAQQRHGQTQERNAQKHEKQAPSLKNVSSFPEISNCKIVLQDIKGLQANLSSLDTTPIRPVPGPFQSKTVVMPGEISPRKTICSTSEDNLENTQNQVSCQQKTAIHSTRTYGLTSENSDRKTNGTIKRSQQIIPPKAQGSLGKTIAVPKVNPREIEDKGSPRAYVPQTEARQAQSPLSQQRSRGITSSQTAPILAGEWTAPSTAEHQPALLSPLLKRRRLFLPEEVAGLILQEPVEDCTGEDKTLALEKKCNRELIVRLAPLDIHTSSCPWVQQSGDSCPGHDDSIGASRRQSFSPETDSSIGRKRARSPGPSTEPHQLQEHRGNSCEKVSFLDMNKMAPEFTVLSAVKHVSQSESLMETSTTELRHLCTAENTGTETQSDLPKRSRLKPEAATEQKENTAVLPAIMSNAEVIPLKSFCRGPSSDGCLSPMPLLQTYPENDTDVIVDSEDEGSSNLSKVSLQNYQKTKYNTYIPTFREHFRKKLLRRVRPGAALDIE